MVQWGHSESTVYPTLPFPIPLSTPLYTHCILTISFQGVEEKEAEVKEEEAEVVEEGKM